MNDECCLCYLSCHRNRNTEYVCLGNNYCSCQSFLFAQRNSLGPISVSAQAPSAQPYLWRCNGRIFCSLLQEVRKGLGADSLSCVARVLQCKHLMALRIAPALKKVRRKTVHEQEFFNIVASR